MCRVIIIWLLFPSVHCPMHGVFFPSIALALTHFPMNLSIRIFVIARGRNRFSVVPAYRRFTRVSGAWLLAAIVFASPRAHFLFVVFVGIIAGAWRVTAGSPCAIRR